MIEEKETIYINTVDDEDENIEYGVVSSNRGDEEILEGVTILDNDIDNGIYSSDDEEEDDIVIHIHKSSSNKRQSVGNKYVDRASRTYVRPQQYSNTSADSKQDLEEANKLKHMKELKALRFSNHRTAFDIDIDSLENHPWRKSNVNMSDYFNYGFNEETWRIYSEKQLRLRAAKGQGPFQSSVAQVTNPPKPNLPSAPTAESIQTASTPSQSIENNDKSVNPSNNIPSNIMNSNNYQGVNLRPPNAPFYTSNQPPGLYMAPQQLNANIPYNYQSFPPPPPVMFQPPTYDNRDINSIPNYNNFQQNYDVNEKDSRENDRREPRHSSNYDKERDRDRDRGGHRDKDRDRDRDRDRERDGRRSNRDYDRSRSDRSRSRERDRHRR